MGAGGAKNFSVGICDGVPSTARSSISITVTKNVTYPPAVIFSYIFTKIIVIKICSLELGVGLFNGSFKTTCLR